MVSFPGTTHNYLFLYYSNSKSFILFKVLLIKHFKVWYMGYYDIVVFNFDVYSAILVAFFSISSEFKNLLEDTSQPNAKF